MPKFKNLLRKYCKTGTKNKKSAGEGIRTLELLQDWVLSPAPLTRLGNPCTKTWRYDKNAPAGIFRDGTFAQILIIKIIYFTSKMRM